MAKKKKLLSDYFEKTCEVDEYGDEEVIKVWLDNDEVCCWNNDDNIDCPEDLTWEREIASVFYNGVRAGLILAQKMLLDDCKDLQVK